MKRIFNALRHPEQFLLLACNGHGSNSTFVPYAPSSGALSESLTSSGGNTGKRSRTKFGVTARAFTLAEVLITLAIIGVVAALTIPSVISNSQQQEFKTGLRKAVSVLNSAITMNMALDGESPYDNANLFGYLMKHMAVMESGTNLKYMVAAGGQNPNGENFYTKNSAFYTTDGMRFEFTYFNISKFSLYENRNVRLCSGPTAYGGQYATYNWKNEPIYINSCGGCGSYGLNSNSDKTTKPPCLIAVDVNGDRKPNPNNVNCKQTTCSTTNIYKYADPAGKKLTDIFSIMITDKEAIPYGVTAQKAMYSGNSVARR